MRERERERERFFSFGRSRTQLYNYISYGREVFGFRSGKDEEAAWVTR